MIIQMLFYDNYYDNSIAIYDNYHGNFVTIDYRNKLTYHDRLE